MKSQAPSSKSQISSKLQVPKGVLGASISIVSEGRQEGSRCVQLAGRPEPPETGRKTHAPRQGRQKRYRPVVLDRRKAPMIREPARSAPAGAQSCLGGFFRWFQARCAFHRPATVGAPLRGGWFELSGTRLPARLRIVPSSGRPGRDPGFHLGFGAWSFFGIWSLGFGISQP